MSWTFELRGDNGDEHEKEFVELIERPVESKKVILCGALPDKGPTVNTRQFAPVRASRPLGRDPHWVGHHLRRSIAGQLLGKHVSGSSYATAYAAGLAATVLYSLKAYHLLDEDYEDGTFAKALARAKTIPGMTAIFSRPSQRNPEDKSDRGVFVKPYITFGQDFNSGGSEAKILTGILNEVLPPSDLRTLYL